MFRILLIGGLAATAFGIPAAADDDLPEPTRRQIAASQNNLKQIALAMHNYLDANGHFPNNTYDKDKKGLLSWRVHILPYVEQSDLYKQFKLDEAWDSENNKALIAKMPKIYAPIRAKAKAGETFYRGFEGKGAVFGADNAKGVRIQAIQDGTSNTGLVFEAADPVIWTKPEDLAFDAKKALPKLGGLFNGASNVAVCDGSVRRLKKDPDDKELRKLIGVNDGEAIDFDKLEPK